MLIESHSAFQNMLHAGLIPYMVNRQCAQLPVAQQIDAAVSHMPDHIAIAMQHQCTERADQMPVIVLPIFSGKALRQQPAVDRLQYFVQSVRDRPGIRRGVIIGQQTAHAEFGSLTPAAAAAHAIGQRRHDTLGCQGAAFRHDDAAIVLVGGSCAGCACVAAMCFKCHGISRACLVS